FVASSLNPAHFNRQRVIPLYQEGWIEPASPASRPPATHLSLNHHSCLPTRGLETGCVARCYHIALSLTTFPPKRIGRRCSPHLLPTNCNVTFPNLKIRSR